MSDKHLSSQFDAELSGISTRVLEMGGLVESQVAQAIYALTHFSEETSTTVLELEERVNQMEMEIDADLSTIIARRQPTARRGHRPPNREQARRRRPPRQPPRRAARCR